MTFGSSSDKPEGCEMFVSGRDVVILADNDKPGLKHAAAIFARSAKSVKVVSFEEKDVSDWIEAGGTVDELWRRVDAAQCVEIKEPTTPDTPLPIFSAAELAGKPVPERRFHVPEWIPARNVTLIYGDGGTGKSLIALQLAVATVLGSTWLGLPVAGGPALYLTAEDEKDEVHRRLVDIAQHLGTSLNDLGNLHIVSLAGLDAVLATPDRKSSLLAPTALLGKIEKAIADIRPAFVILDTLADIYGGEENIRTQVRQFVGMLRGLALQHDTTIAVPAHPSLSGLSSGSGSSGSTGWNNSVRSRLYLERVKDESGAEPDPNARVLRKMKANYSTIGDEIRVRWERGVFVPTSAAATGFSALAAKQDADEIFATLVGAYQTEKRHVSSTPSANFAPAVFARDARSQGIGKKALGDAMNRLFAARRIKVLEVGPPSRRLKSIVLANAETALDP
jgi:RecA-family ATPase